MFIVLFCYEMNCTPRLRLQLKWQAGERMCKSAKAISASLKLLLLHIRERTEAYFSQTTEARKLHFPFPCSETCWCLIWAEAETTQTGTKVRFLNAWFSFSDFPKRGWRRVVFCRDAVSIAQRNIFFPLFIRLADSYSRYSIKKHIPSGRNSHQQPTRDLQGLSNQLLRKCEQR